MDESSHQPFENAEKKYFILFLKAHEKALGELQDKVKEGEEELKIWKEKRENRLQSQNNAFSSPIQPDKQDHSPSAGN